MYIKSDSHPFLPHSYLYVCSYGDIKHLIWNVAGWLLRIFLPLAKSTSLGIKNRSESVWSAPSTSHLQWGHASSYQLATLSSIGYNDLIGSEKRERSSTRRAAINKHSRGPPPFFGGKKVCLETFARVLIQKSHCWLSNTFIHQVKKDYSLYYTQYKGQSLKRRIG